MRNWLMVGGLLVVGAGLGAVAQTTVLAGGTPYAIGTAPVQLYCAVGGRPAAGVTPTASAGGSVGGAASLIVTCPLGGVGGSGGAGGSGGVLGGAGGRGGTGGSGGSGGLGGVGGNGGSGGAGGTGGVGGRGGGG